MAEVGAGQTGSQDMVELLPNFWMLQDSCNVYLLKHDDRALLVDFGTGKWLDALTDLGVGRVDHVLLTHHHADQCSGLLRRKSWPFAVHAPAGEQLFLDPENPERFGPPPWHALGCPPSYRPLADGIPNVKYDISGSGHLHWCGRRLQFVHTPGHGPNACSVVVEHHGKQLVFCGDAAHAGGTMWEPFHLEWDHWTGTGALAAWEGVQRLLGLAVDLLCPSHGPVIGDECWRTLEQLAARLLSFYRVKGQISPGEPDRWAACDIMACGACRYSEHLYQFGSNGYLLVSDSGQAVVVDPFSGDMDALDELLGELGSVRPTAAVVSHYHYDHCDGIEHMRRRYGVEVWLHPLVAQPWEDPASTYLPWLLPETIVPDHLWPDRGKWSWNEYDFDIAHWPGQTWWHCGFMTTVDDRRVMFGGDSFTPSSKWNGTGGFCAYNRSRFDDGFIRSAELVLDWQPDIIAAGHTNCYRFSRSKFVKIAQWAEAARDAVAALCPSGDLDADYYSVHRLLRRTASSDY